MLAPPIATGTIANVGGPTSDTTIAAVIARPIADTRAAVARPVADAIATVIARSIAGTVAAVDDFLIVNPTCSRPPCSADFNGDGNVSVTDIFDYLAAYFNTSASADFDHNGSVTVTDIFNFLAVYFIPCP